MKIYMVGGAVRDLLQGSAPRDTDYCVVGSAVEEMLRLGFTQVGADFPVFLHPETHDEYALARVERKTGVGYNGFATETKAVTLEEDLSRRDLTINAMAMDSVFQLIDPFGGRKDLEDKLLRHVSVAFRDDPLRVLRVARFRARFGPEWRIAEETWALMSWMTDSGSLDTLSQERVWVEIERGLMEPHPELMLETLRILGVFERKAFAEYGGAQSVDIRPLKCATASGEDLGVRFALAFPRVWQSAEVKSSRIPKMVREVSHILTLGRERGLGRFSELTPLGKVTLLDQLDAFRQSDRTSRVLNALAYLDGNQVHSVGLALAAVSDIKKAQIIAGLTDGEAIRARLLNAKAEAIAAAC